MFCYTHCRAIQTINSMDEDKGKQQHCIIKTQLWPILTSAIDVGINMPKEVMQAGDQMSYFRQASSISGLHLLRGQREGGKRRRDQISGTLLWPRHLVIYQDEQQYKGLKLSRGWGKHGSLQDHIPRGHPKPSQGSKVSSFHKKS